jgi:RNA polymerase primary sigma factor
MTQTIQTFSTGPNNALDAYFRRLEGSKPLSAEAEAECAGAIDLARVQLWSVLLGEPLVRRRLHSAILSSLELTESMVDAMSELVLNTKRTRVTAIREDSSLPLACPTLATDIARADRDDALAGILSRDVANLRLESEPIVHLRLRKNSIRSERFETFAEEVAVARHGLHRAKNKMAKANLRLVVQMAKRYTYSSIPLMDLVQEGNIGLLKAVDRFEVDRGFRFSTFASWWIRHALSRCVYNGSSTVRIPVHVQERHRQIAGTRRQLELKDGEAPDVEQVAKSVGLSVEKIRAADGVRSYRTTSFHGPTHPGSVVSIEETLSDPEERSSVDFISDANLRDSLGPAFGALDAVEYDILKRRFGLDGEKHQTLRAVGAVHGLSRERIRQIQCRALEKMRVCIESGPVAA